MKTIVANIEAIKEYFGYSPEHGRLFWIKRPAKPTSVGSLAGTIGNNGYRYINFKRRKYLEHRLVWVFCHGDWPKNDIDHINGDKQDNRIENLRDVTHSVNRQNNRQARSDSLTGVLGVSRTKNNQFSAQIYLQGKRKVLGYFSTPEAAHEAYLTAKRQLHEGCTI